MEWLIGPGILLAFILLGIYGIDFLVRRWIDYGRRKKDTLRECQKIHKDN